MTREQGHGQVIVNGDDLGMSPGINQAIQQLHEQGRLNSASIMANTPWSAEAFTFARQATGLRLGIHLNLSTGKPMLAADQVATLVQPDGRFLDLPVLMSRLFAGRINRHEIEAELSAQVTTCLEHGLQPVQIDSHMHFHAIPTLAKIVTNLAVRYGIPSVRNPNLSAFIIPPRAKANLFQNAVRKTGGQLLVKTQSLLAQRAIVLNKPAPTADHLLYLRWCLQTSDNPAIAFQACLNSLQHHSLEIIAHPAKPDEVLPSLSGYVNGRQREFEFLNSEQFWQIMQQNELHFD